MIIERFSARTRLRLGLAGALLLVAGALWWYARADRGGAEPAVADAWRQPVPVRVVAARREALPVNIRAIGTVTALNTVAVRSRVEGELKRVLFDEGQTVKRGELLAEIDPEPYRVRLAQAEGQQQQNQAQLDNAEQDLALYRGLFEQDSIARQQLQQQEARVHQLRGTRKADQAQVDDAKLQLAYTRIEAPIGGRVGFRQVDAGNLVGAADSGGLVIITQTQPIAVVFTIPEAELPAVHAEFARGRPLTVEAWDRGEQLLLASGVLKTLDNRIDLDTGTLKLKATFDNRDEVLFPNRFVNVRLQVKTLPDAVTIPADAVQYGAAGTYVYLIDPASKARIRKVEVGPADAGRVAIVSGLADGERVVLEGLDRLREGREVVLVETPPAAAPTERSSG